MGRIAWEGMPWGDTMGVINGGQCHGGEVPWEDAMGTSTMGV